jgi:O-antigen/teichoic acid export membrane protein
MVFRRFLGVLAGKAGALLVFLIGLPLLTRILGPAKFGQYAVFYSLFSVCALVVLAGIPDGIRRFGTDSQYEAEKADVLRFYLQTGLAVGVIAASILLLLSQIPIVPQKFQQYFFYLAGALLGYQCFELFRSLLMVDAREMEGGLLHTFHRGVAILGGAVLAEIGIGLSGVFTAFVAAGVLSTVLTYWKVRKLVPNLKFRVPTVDWKELLGYTSLLHLEGIFEVLLWNVDILLLGLFTTSAPVGRYKAALSIVEMLAFVPVAMQTFLIYTGFNEQWSRGATDKISSQLRPLIKYTVLLVILLSIGVFFVGGEFMNLYYGSGFSATRELQILLVGGACFAVARPLMGAHLASPSPISAVKATGAAAILNLLLTLALIPSYGTTGAAIATTVSYASVLLFQIVATHGLGLSPMKGLPFARITIAVGIGAVTAELLSKLVQPSTPRILVVAVGTSTLFVLTAFITKIISIDEIRNITRS